MAPHEAEVARLQESVLGSDAISDSSLRAAAFAGVAVPAPWSAYVRKVKEESYRVTDRDIQELIASGCPEDAIFEVTVAAALGAAGSRLESGLRALAEAD